MKKIILMKNKLLKKKIKIKTKKTIRKKKMNPKRNNYEDITNKDSKIENTEQTSNKRDE